MSRIIRFHQFGEADVLKIEERQSPVPAAGEVLIGVEAIGVSWYDVLWRQNLAPTPAHLPATPGHEVAGVVLALGEGVDDLAVGDKVASFPGHSLNRYPGYAEQVVLPRSSLTLYPETLTAQQASGHYQPSLVGWFGFVELAKLKSGETVLVTAASQCWGPYIVQIGKALGARVIAATEYADDADYLRELGADAVILTEEQDLVSRVVKLTDGRGVDIVMDALGGPQMCLLGDVLAPRGRLILFGLQGGNETPFPACAAFQKNIQFFVHCLGNFTGKEELGIPQDKDAVAKALQGVNQLTRDGLLRTQIERVFAFDQVVAAHRLMETCPRRGRVILQV
ncbi:NADPH:quinone reductase-like Zn-dependent oxidoreductase [Pseudomonas fluvialis]|uniref:NADPH:quinone reductase-like Zn-dependent oxidoreductase n=1 Tax=Pseudomonas fluvialis TaxID=1793966 RepID=A0A7X0BTZ4_9PSED|nr:zinc-dependent alcohol dehydrogenase family protein [Pseudomonas fluvialis]MBB6342852.1 NADPH:quinone reductase-like Zn-dependent oxidoreductase [Pseudomonas fluvialis]